MKSYRIEMWQDGRKLLLKDLLACFTIPKDVSWSLLEFSGSGEPPAGGRMQDFESEVLRTTAGVAFSAEQLDQFATSLTDVTEMHLIGWRNGQSVLEIRGLDSTFWEVAVDGVYASPKRCLE